MLDTIYEQTSFVIENDTLENAISATLNQQNQPVAFFCIILNKHEYWHSRIEKEAAALLRLFKNGPILSVSAFQSCNESNVSDFYV